MNKIKEIVNQITRKQWIISAVVVLIALIAFGFIKNPKMWPLSIFERDEAPKKEFVLDSQSEEVVIKEDFTEENVRRGEYQNSVTAATTYVRNTDEVRVAVVIDENQKLLKSDTQSISCGQIAFVSTRVTGPAVLTNTLRAMFEDKIQTDFTPGNIIPKYHPQLTLGEVKINNGVAQIYLGGNFSGSQDGWCDSSLAIAQITETAKTFSTVQSVEVYQNGSRIY